MVAMGGTNFSRRQCICALLSSEASEEQTCLLFRASDDKIPRGLATVVGMLPVLSLPNTLRSWRREGFIKNWF